MPSTYNESNQCVNPGKVLVYTNSLLFLECLFHHSFIAHCQATSLLDANRKCSNLQCVAFAEGLHMVSTLSSEFLAAQFLLFFRINFFLIYILLIL